MQNRNDTIAAKPAPTTYSNQLLITSAYCGDVKNLQHAMKMGADINTLNKDKCTALMLAASTGNIDGLRILLQANANVNLVDKDGYTAIDYAIYHNRYDCFEVLWNTYSDAYQKENVTSFLQYAIETGYHNYHNEPSYYKFITFFMSAGASIKELKNIERQLAWYTNKATCVDIDQRHKNARASCIALFQCIRLTPVPKLPLEILANIYGYVYPEAIKKSIDMKAEIELLRKKNLSLSHGKSVILFRDSNLASLTNVKEPPKIAIESTTEFPTLK